MATSDRWPIKEQPCKCGKGSIIVYECEPGHNYVKDHQRWYEGGIDCPECSQYYEIIMGYSKRSIHLKDKRSGESECIFEKE